LRPSALCLRSRLLGMWFFAQGGRGRLRKVSFLNAIESREKGYCKPLHWKIVVVRGGSIHEHRTAICICGSMLRQIGWFVPALSGSSCLQNLMLERPRHCIKRRFFRFVLTLLGVEALGRFFGGNEGSTAVLARL
jgi:hypothetical protein